MHVVRTTHQNIVCTWDVHEYEAVVSIYDVLLYYVNANALVPTRHCLA